MARHIFLTGGTGYLGANVLKAALAQGDRVTMLVRPESGFAQTDAAMGGPGWQDLVTCVSAPSAGAFVDWFATLGIDAVVHTAARGGYALAQGQVQDVIDANITLGALILESLHQLRQRDGVNRPMVFCGTYWQHSAPDGSRLPNSFYAATKTAFEDIANYYHTVLGHRVLGLKFYDIYGTADLRRRIVDLIVDTLGNREAAGFSSGTQEILPLFGRDAAEAVISALRLLDTGQPLALTYGAAGPERVSLRELAALVESRAGRKANIEWGALPDRDREVRNPFVLDPLPGWTPQTGLAAGIDEVLKGRNV